MSKRRAKPKRRAKIKTVSGSERVVRDVPKVRIGASVFAVRVLRGRRCGPVKGCIHFDKSVIHLHERLDRRAALTTLIHECFHGIVDDRGDFPWLDWIENVVKHKKGEKVPLVAEGIESMVDEIATKSMEKGFVTLVRDNPKMMRMMINEFSKT